MRARRASIRSEGSIGINNSELAINNARGTCGSSSLLIVNCSLLIARVSAVSRQHVVGEAEQCVALGGVGEHRERRLGLFDEVERAAVGVVERAVATQQVLQLAPGVG